MLIKLKDIPPEGLILDIAQGIDLFDEGSESATFKASLKVRLAENAVVRVAGRIKAKPRLECSRCLKTFPYNIDTEVSSELAPVRSLGKEHEHELGRGELDTEFYSGDEIDVLGIVREHMLLAMPMYPLHGPDCRGLCTVCGADLNEAECGCARASEHAPNAFATLKDLLKK